MYIARPADISLTCLFRDADLFGLIPILRVKIRSRGLENVLAIAKDPFDTKIITKGKVTFDSGDWNGQ